MTKNTSLGYIPASKGLSDLTLYVNEDATGTGDGSSKANGFTSLQDAIDAIPDVAQNVTIIVCKGSTNYLGQTTTIQKASVKSLAIQGEFYANEACDANAVAGKVVDADADFSNFAVGDRVVCTKYSGTVGSSSIDDYFYATITEVGEGYVQTSEETKVPTTGWRYLINQTVFDGNSSISYVISAHSQIFLLGICGINNTAAWVMFDSGNLRCAIYNCILYNVGGCISRTNNSLYVLYTAILNSNGTFAISGIYGSNITFENSVFSATSNSTSYGAYLEHNSQIEFYACGFFNFQRAVIVGWATSCAVTRLCYIASTCTYGAYGYNITLVSCTNNAATPVTNLTSGGSIEEWDGQALPSIDDATGGQVLALKSDKSGLEFATASGGGGITWNEVTGTTQAASADNGYITNNESLVTVTLPSTCAVGKTIRIAGKGAGLWKVAQNAGQTIYFGDQNSTSGTAGYIAARYQYDAVELLCITANTTFLVIGNVGNLDVI